jgi:hypothetical protein
MGFTINNGVLEQYREEAGITDVVIPDNVNSIGKSAFSYCRTLTNITIPEGVTSIGVWAFAVCTSLINITVPEGVTSIGKEAFIGCNSLSSITIPRSLTNIGYRAFWNCESLTSIFIPEGVTSIEDSVFSYCKNLTSITIPEGVTSIGEGAFQGCIGLSSVIFPTGVTIIRQYAFKDCTNLTSIVVPNSIISLSDLAFDGCSRLSNVVLPSGISNFEELKLSTRRNAKEFIIPKTVKAIGDDTFRDWRGLASITIPEGVTGIGDSVFRGCKSLASIILPESITNIGKEAFEGCTSLIEMDNMLLLIRNGCNVEATTIVWLLENLWKESWHLKETAEVYLTKKAKAINEICESRFLTDCDRSVDVMIGLIETYKNKPPALKKMADFAMICGDQLSKEKLLALYEALKKVGAKPAAVILEKAVQSETDLGVEGAVVHPIETICLERFNETLVDRDLKAYGLSPKLFTGVRYQGTETLAPEFVMKCAILPYMQKLKELPTSVSLSSFIWVELDPQIDEIASVLEREDLQQLLDRLISEVDLLRIPRFLIPYCRFGSGKQMNSLASLGRQWKDGFQYGDRGTRGIIVMRGAMLLNESREAIILSEKWHLLDEYARRMGTTADILRDTVLTEFDLDADGSKRYDLGNAMIVASPREDLTVHLFNETTGKNVRLLPTKGADPEKLSIASEDLADLKKNIKNAVKSKVNKLKEDFVSASESRASDWKTSYTQNYVLKRIASLLVWQWNLNTTTSRFMLLMDGSFIDCSGQPVEVNDEVTICLAHPVELPIDELECWRELLAQKQIAQPFVQIFEPVIDMDPAVVSEHYEGVELPLYLLKGLSREGVKLEYGRDDDYAYLELIGHAVRAGVDYDDRRSLYVIPSLAYDHIVKLRNVRINGTRRAVNHEVYAMDKALISNRVRYGDIAAVQAVSHVITAKTIEHLIDVSIKAQQMECTAWLMNYKNDHFPYALADLEL